MRSRKVLSIAVAVALGAMGAVTGGLPASAHAGHQITVTDGAVNEGGTVTLTVTVTPLRRTSGAAKKRSQ